MALREVPLHALAFQRGSINLGKSICMSCCSFQHKYMGHIQTYACRRQADSPFPGLDSSGKNKSLQIISPDGHKFPKAEPSRLRYVLLSFIIVELLSKGKMGATPQAHYIQTLISFFWLNVSSKKKIPNRKEKQKDQQRQTVFQHAICCNHLHF